VGTIVLNIPGLAQINQLLPFTYDTYGGGVGFSFQFFLNVTNGFLENVSNRVTLTVSDPAITGFVISGNSPRLVVIRAVGPSLTNFNVSPVSNNPQFALFSSSGSELEIGQKWSLVTIPTLHGGPGVVPQTQFDAQAMGWIFGIAGAFPLNSNSNDEAYFNVLSPGAYTVVVSDPTVGPIGGSALIEVYILPYSE
jgi:hypothetical protein